MTQDNALHQREPNPGAFELVAAVQPLEYAEEFRAVLHVEPDAVVANVVRILVSAFLESDLDGRTLPGASEFESIRNQVVENLSNHCAVAKSRRKSVNLDQKVPFLVGGLNFIERALRQILHVDVGLIER